MEKSNLLIISDRYPHAYDPKSSSFVKGQVDALKKYFRNVYVLSLIPYVPKFLCNQNFMHPRWNRDAYAQDYQYDNVKVYFAKYNNLPLHFFYSRKGAAAFNSANKIIEENKLQFDLMHAHFTYPSGFVAAKLKEVYNKPFILTVHEDHNWLLEEISSKDNKFKYAWLNANKVIRVNKADLEEFAKLDINESKLIALPNGFSPSLFRPKDMTLARKELGLPINGKILVNIANLEEYKGQKYLIEAINLVLAKRNDAILYIVGEGSLFKELQLLIENSLCKEDIVLAGGNRPAEEIPLWMNACDVFILPSLSEGNPTVMFEALGCGKPFIGTNVGGIPEIIINDKLGILVEPKDANGLAEAILKASNTKWDAEYIQDYAGRFTWEKIAEKIVEVYNEVLSEY